MNELVPYLNDYLAVQIWRPAHDLIGNLTVSQLDNFLREQPLLGGLEHVYRDFSRNPTVEDVDDNSVLVRVPGIPSLGRHPHFLLEASIVMSGPLPNPDIQVRMAAFVTASTGPANIQVPEPAIEFDWISDFAVLVLGGVPALIAKRIVEEVVEEVLPGELVDRIRSQLAGFEAYRFDRLRDLLPAVPGNPLITPAFHLGFSGSADPRAQGYCDILLVADGCGNAADIDRFNFVVENIRSHFGGLSGDPLETPFNHFASAIRFWRMPLAVADPADRLQRGAFPVATPQGDQMNFSNLARVADIGLTAREFFGRDPITAFVSLVTPADRNAAGVMGSIRANAQGPYLLLELPQSAFPNIEGGNVRRTFVHELGHTPLGRYLADEYDDGGGAVYRGPEPMPRNVSIGPNPGQTKWQAWNTDPEFAANGPRESAYEHDSGIFRFHENCRMRDSDIGDFCPICREELALGLLECSHLATGVAPLQGMIDLSVEYLSPWAQAPQVVHIAGGQSANLEVFSGGRIERPSTRVRLAVVGSSIPQLWEITWRVTRGPGVGTEGELTGPSVDVFVSSGATVVVTVRHNRIATGIFAPGGPEPETSVTLVFDRQRALTPAHLRPPTNLRQSVALGGGLAPQIDPATGAVTLAGPLWISAELGFVRDFMLTPSVLFELNGPGGYQRDRISLPGPQGEERRWSIMEVPPPGRYTWSARTYWSGVSGPAVEAPRAPGEFCFEIGALPFVGNPQPPVRPYGLRVLETGEFPPRPAGLEAYSWHPNDRPIKFHFEYRLDNEAWGDARVLETSLISRDPQVFDSVAVRGWDLFGGLPLPAGSGDQYRWRVKAIDDVGRESEWVEGQQFIVFLPDGRPTTLRDLARILETLRPGMLTPRGPGDLPRVFIPSDWPVDQRDTDFSRLKKWTQPPEKTNGAQRGDRSSSIEQLLGSRRVLEEIADLSDLARSEVGRAE